MLSLAAPWWLLGLLALPLIRWLHRGGPLRQALPVSRLAWWQGSAHGQPDAGARRPPDPAWLRRALLAALLLAALAQPQWTRPGQQVTLWIDNSPSLLLREDGGTRLDLGWALARTQLAERPGTEVQVRRLGDPWRDLGPPTVQPPAPDPGGAQTLAPPPAPLLDGRRAHWIITDGAHPELLAWPDGRRPDRVIAVGTVTRNVGIERIAARRHASRKDAVDVLVKLTNGGDDEASRELVFSIDGAVVQRATRRLAAGVSVWIEATLPASASVSAALAPSDALPDDDAVVLDLAPLRARRVAVDPGCSAPWRAAVAVHPALAGVTATDPDIDAVLVCGPSSAPASAPTLRVRADAAPLALRGALRWARSADGMPPGTSVGPGPADPSNWQVTASLASEPGDLVLLAVDDTPVIVERKGPSRQLETSLALGAAADAGAAQAPLLVNWMFERLLDAPLLDATASVDRGPGAARVVPSRPAAADAPTPDVEMAWTDAVRALLLVAAAVLLWELTALARQWARLRERAPAPAA